MASKKPMSEAPKIVDITPPGKSVPNASGRPIIVSSRPLLRQDPMILGDASADTPPSQAEGPKLGRSIRTVAVTSDSSLDISPPASSLSPDSVLIGDETVPTLTKPPIVAAAVAPSPIVPPEPLPETLPKPEEKAAEAVPPVAAVAVDDEASDEQLAPNQTLEDAKRKEQEAADARLAAQEQLIASKQYYVPITTPSGNRGTVRAFIILLAVLLLAAVWADMVLDAGIVHVAGLHSLTHFFGN